MENRYFHFYFSMSDILFIIYLQGYYLWELPVHLDNLPMTKKIVASIKLRSQELCLEDILPWESYRGLKKFTVKPKNKSFKIPLPSYNKFLDIYNEVTSYDSTVRSLFSY